MKKAIILIFVLLFSLLFFARVSAAANTVDVYYFFDNPCASCDEEKKFSDMAAKAFKGIEKNTPYRIFNYNLFNQSNMNTFEKVCEKFNILPEKRILPMVLINGGYLTGKDNIEKNLKTFFTEITTSSKPNYHFSINEEELPEYKNTTSQKIAPQSIDPNNSYFIYFHTVSCEDCHRTETFLSSLEKNYTIEVKGTEINSTVVIESRNLAEITEVSEIHAYFEAYHVPLEKQQVPIIFYKGGYISGYTEIEAKLLPIISSGAARNFTYPQNTKTVSGFTAKNLPTIFLAGLINGINPCSISMVFLLLTLLLSKNVNILKLGMSYIAGKIIAYSTLGTIFYHLVSLLESTVFQSVQLFLKGLLLFFIVGLVLLNLWDLIAAKKEKYQHIKVQLPKPLRKFNHSLIKKLEDIPLKWALPIVFGLGIIISAGEFLCTGQIYLATIIYLVKSSPSFNFITAAAFMVYVLAMSIPLIILIFLVNRGSQLLDLSEFTRKNLPIIKLMNAILFVLFGVYIIWAL